MQHQWVKHEITPVHVLPDPAGGEPAIFVDPDDQDEASGMAQYGCFSCDVHLNEETVLTECPGGEEGEASPKWVDLWGVN